MFIFGGWCATQTLIDMVINSPVNPRNPRPVPLALPCIPLACRGWNWVFVTRYLYQSVSCLAITTPEVYGSDMANVRLSSVHFVIVRVSPTTLLAVICRVAALKEVIDRLPRFQTSRSVGGNVWACAFQSFLMFHWRHSNTSIGKILMELASLTLETQSYASNSCIWYGKWDFCSTGWIWYKIL